MALGKILLVDDDPDIKSIYKEVLTQAGYNFDYADNGEKGLAKILQGGYDLILLDIMMPKIDGISILKRLHENPPNPSVYNGPIFVLSQLNQKELVDTAISLGAKGYLVKAHLAPDDLLKRVGEILQNLPPQA